MLCQAQPDLRFFHSQAQPDYGFFTALERGQALVLAHLRPWHGASHNPDSLLRNAVPCNGPNPLSSRFDPVAFETDSGILRKRRFPKYSSLTG